MRTCSGVNAATSAARTEGSKVSWGAGTPGAVGGSGGMLNGGMATAGAGAGAETGAGGGGGGASLPLLRTQMPMR
jgi:hypothetical protein